jgi:hypothetical protein
MDYGTAASTNSGLNTLADYTINGNTGTLNNFNLAGSGSNWVESYAQITPQSPTTSAIVATGFTASWTAPAYGSVDNYVIDVATDPAFTYIVSGYNAKNVGNVLTTNVTGLATGIPYYWRVRADKTSVTGTGNNTAYQTVTTTFQKPGQALSFDGTDDSIGIGTTGAVTGTNPFAVELWVKTTSAAEQYLVQQRSASNIDGEYILEMLSDGTVNFWLFNNTGVNPSITTLQKVNDGKWHHIAATRESDQSLRIYIDVNLAATASAAKTSEIIADILMEPWMRSAFGTQVVPKHKFKQVCLTKSVQVHRAYYIIITSIRPRVPTWQML